MVRVVGGVVLGVCALVGCNTPLERVPGLVVAPSGLQLTVDVGTFSTQERRQFEDCFSDWRTFSSGRVDVRVGRGGFMAFRGMAPDRSSMSYFSYEAQAMWLEVDNPEHVSLGLLCRGMLGAAAGLKLHDGVGVMAERDADVTEGFTADDEVACRAAGACP